MNIKPQHYPKLNNFDITVLSINGSKIYFEYSEATFRAYVNKKIYAIFSESLYECIFGYENTITGKKYYLYNEDLSLLVSNGSTLTIYDTFKITKDNELTTRQDIVDYFKSVGEGIFKFENNQITETYSENSKIGLLSIFDKVKLDNSGLFIKTENIVLTDEFSPIINLKVKTIYPDIPSNIYRII